MLAATGGRRADGVDLGWLLAGLVAAPRVRVRDLRADSRDVRDGDAFVAVAGRTTHGLDHAAEAAARGAAAVLYDPADGRAPPTLPPGVALVAVPGLAPELGALADRRYGEPSLATDVTGITGTNGKTTCAWLLAQAGGADGAYAGTLGWGRPPAVEAATHTTPDVLSVHRLLAALRDAGFRSVAMEVSSHALDQGRVAEVRLPVVGFTNLTRDHLDYHGTMEAYGAAKEKIVRCRGVAHAVVNCDDAFGRGLAARLPAGVALTAVGRAPLAVESARHVVGDAVAARPGGLEIAGRTHAGAFRLRSPLVGEFNAENLLVVLGLLLAGGVPLDDAVAALEAASAPPGRMEAFAVRGGPTLVVDYAHTPDALDKVLAALRAHAAGRIWCVFGCGGDRDPGKRPEMARVAEARADAVVVTDDNPRAEDPERIVAGIRAGFAGRVPVEVERDRATAIRRAARAAGPGDVVLVAGKGHEDYQIVGAERRPYSDREVARELAARGCA